MDDYASLKIGFDGDIMEIRVSHTDYFFLKRVLSSMIRRHKKRYTDSHLTTPLLDFTPSNLNSIDSCDTPIVI